MEVLLLYSKLGGTDNSALHQIKSKLNSHLFDQKKKFRFLKREKQYLTGRYLLQKGLGIYNICPETQQFKYNMNGRPELNSDIDFSISHADAMVACAIIKQGKIGLDIEKYRSLKSKYSPLFFTKQEWSLIKKAPLQIFTIWTRKESIIKAEGASLLKNSRNIHFSNHQYMFNDNQWYCHKICLSGDQYIGHISTDKPNMSLRKLYIETEKL